MGNRNESAKPKIISSRFWILASKVNKINITKSTYNKLSIGQQTWIYNDKLIWKLMTPNIYIYNQNPTTTMCVGILVVEFDKEFNNVTLVYLYRMFWIKLTITWSIRQDQSIGWQTLKLTFPMEVSFNFEAPIPGFLCGFRGGSENHALRDCSSGSLLTTRPSTRSHRKYSELKEILKIVVARWIGE